MQIPSYWAEARVEGKVGERKRVVRRFGWSDESEAAAQAHAQERAELALSELQAGASVPNREQKLAYGKDGLPIREEVLARNGDIIITRNSYGARCLNEPDVLFADIDIAWRHPKTLRWLLATPYLLLLAGGIFGIARMFFAEHVAPWHYLCSLIAIGFGWHFRAPFQSLGKTDKNRDKTLPPVLERLPERFAIEPNARVAVYETPAGVRLLALHRTFEPTSEATQQLFRELGTDPAYSLMCALQSCFRARLTAKPWRIGSKRISYERPGRWPIDESRRERREHLVATYEEAAKAFASCRFLYEFGDGTPDPRCLEVQRIHDELSKARSELPIA